MLWSHFMTDHRSNEVTYSRPQPSQWNELVEFSRNLHDADNPLPRTAAMTEIILGRLGELDDETLEEHRYYAIGLVMCGIAKILRDPDAYVAAVESAAYRLFDYWLIASSTVQPGVLLPSHIQGSFVSSAFTEVSRKAGDALPIEVQFLSDALFVESTDRRFFISRSEEVAVPRSDNVAVRATNNHTDRPSKINRTDGVINRNVAAGFVGRQAAAATAAAIRVVLEKRSTYMGAQQLTKENDANKTFPTTAVEIIDEAGVETLNLNAVGVRCAALRIDEFSESIQDFIDISSEGTVIFRRDRMVPSARLAPPRDADVLHTKRLRCPALFVDSLVPDMIKIIVAAIRRADILVANQDALRRNQMESNQV